jgi:hypothetical protein
MSVAIPREQIETLKTQATMAEKGATRFSVRLGVTGGCVARTLSLPLLRGLRRDFDSITLASGVGVARLVAAAVAPGRFLASLPPRVAGARPQCWPNGAGWPCCRQQWCVGSGI